MQIHLTRSEASWGVRYLLFQLAFLPSLLQSVLGLLNLRLPAVALNIAYWGINFCAACWIFREFLGNSLTHLIQNSRKILLATAVGLAVYIPLRMGLSALSEHLFPQFFNVNDASLAQSARQNYGLMALGVVVLVPITEELFYRGAVFGLLRPYGRFIAYGVSMLAFCTIHVMGYFGSYPPLHLLICFLQYIPAGLVLAGVYEYSGSIFAPTLIHMAVNAIAISNMR